MRFLTPAPGRSSSKIGGLAAGLVLALSAVVAPIGGANATTLYDNLGGSSGGSDPVSAFGPLYDSFSTDSSSYGYLSIKFLVAGDPTDGGSFQLLILDAAPNDMPGLGQVASSTISNSSLPAGCAAGCTFTAAGPVSLNANSRYWVELLSTDSSLQWDWTQDISGTGVASEFYGNSGGFFASAEGAYQMQVVASTVAPTPLPSTWLLSLAGLFGLGLLVRRGKAYETGVLGV